MRKRIYLFLFLILSMFSFSAEIDKKIDKKNLYDTMNLFTKIDYPIFEKALIGYEKIPKKNNDILAIIDYTKPATSKRFYVLDLKKKKILHESLVSHGRNSGINDAIVFSDTPNSYQSCIGFFLTGDTYSGDFGYSLRLKGLEPGINSNAERRSIVIHGAPYVNEDFIKKNGFLGRTLGCPALPLEEVVGVINDIKGGSVLFVAGNDDEYFKNTKY